MDLWIRSQDKKILEKVERIKIVDRYDELNKQYWHEIHCKFENSLNVSYERMAMYKTKERALEVLDEIQTILRGKYATSFDYKTSLKGFKPEDIEHMLELMAVYEMPAE